MEDRTTENAGLLSVLDSQIMRHQAAISFVTGALAVLGVGAMSLCGWNQSGSSGA